MITASELAGYFAAHTVWCLSEAESFNPVLAFTDADDGRHMQRLIGHDTEAAVVFGRKQLAGNPMDANAAALLFDGRLTAEGGKLDAIVIELRCYAFPWAEATLAVPYTPRASGRFRVHRPKLLRWHDCGDFNLDAAFATFFRGVAAHEQGARVWDAALDESR